MDDRGESTDPRKGRKALTNLRDGRPPHIFVGRCEVVLTDRWVNSLGMYAVVVEHPPHCGNVIRAPKTFARAWLYPAEAGGGDPCHNGLEIDTVSPCAIRCRHAVVWQLPGSQRWGMRSVCPIVSQDIYCESRTVGVGAKYRMAFEPTGCHS